jgi:dTDP-D-glucose 4,6-dehydratase
VPRQIRIEYPGAVYHVMSRGDHREPIVHGDAQRELNWKPLHNFRDGLDSTIDWYTNNRAWWEPLRERTGRH